MVFLYYLSHQAVLEKLLHLDNPLSNKARRARPKKWPSSEFLFRKKKNNFEKNTMWSFSCIVHRSFRAIQHQNPSIIEEAFQFCIQQITAWWNLKQKL